ncbi:hypothetical protein N9K37_03740 [Pseudomonadales bacterium]|nr:hypothetical protein [Pseudomonadales bacterium]
MRELTNQEVTAISGGFAGTPIPFRNGFIPGANWPGGAPGFLGGISMAWAAGSAIGAAVNSFNQTVSGMSLGEAIYLTVEN